MTTIKNIDVHTLKTLIDSEVASPKIIDVREIHEWHEIRIPHTIHIPKGEIKEKMLTIEPDLQTPLYLHCYAGIRSEQAAMTLLELGYESVYSVEGGIQAWISAGYPTVS